MIKAAPLHFVTLVCCGFVAIHLYKLVVQSPSCVWLFATPRTAHGRPPCPVPSPRVCPSSCSLHWWCHSAISPSDALLSFCPQSFPTSGTFPMSRLFTSQDQNTGASASALVLPVNIQGWSPLRLTGLTSLLSKGLWGFSSSTTSLKASVLWCSAFFTVQLLQLYMITGKTIALTVLPLLAE